jgi:hypothetical protein
MSVKAHNKQLLRNNFRCAGRLVPCGVGLSKVLKFLGITTGIILFLLLAYVGIFFYWLSSTVDFEPTTFDAIHWQSSTPEMSWESLRLKMVDDLVENHISEGQSKSEILTILGKPTETEYFSDFDMVYYLGLERNAIAIDSEWLLINFTDNKVRQIRIATD